MRVRLRRRLMVVGLALAVAVVFVTQTFGQRSAGSDESAVPRDTIFESVRGLCAAVDVHDPLATDERLGRAGFGVRWFVVDFARDGSTRSTPVDRPPDGFGVMSVTARDGSYERVPSTTRDITIEVAKPGEHPVAPDAACG